MTLEKLKEVMDRRPFRPFKVWSGDGSVVDVRGQEFIMRTPGGRTVYVATGKEEVQIIDWFLVTKISTDEGTFPAGPKESGNGESGVPIT